MSEWLHYGSALGLLSNLLSLLSLVPELSEVRPHVQSQLLNKYQLQRSGSRALGFKVTPEVKRKTGTLGYFRRCKHTSSYCYSQS